MFGPKDAFKSVSAVSGKVPGKGDSLSNPNVVAAGRLKQSSVIIGRRDTSDDERATLLKELSDPFGAAQIRAVSACLDMATIGFSTTLALWCFGFGVILIRVANPALISNSILNSYWIWFIPFWLGDFAAFFFQVRLLVHAYLLRFLNSEQQVALKRRYGSISPPLEGGTLPSMALPADLQGLGLGPLGHSVVVDIAYMPLVQRTVVTTLMIFTLLVLLVVQQVLACIELSSISPHGKWSTHGLKFSMVICLLPLLLLEIFALLRVLLIRTKGPLLLAGYFLIFLGTLSVAAKIDGIKEVLLADGSWVLALSPFLILIVMFMGLILYISIGALFGRFQLTRSQQASILLYFLALIFLSGGIALLAARPTVEEVFNWEWEVREESPVVAIWCATAMGALAVCIAFEGAMHRLMLTKGFEDPVPLSKTSKGWEPSGARNAYWSLLGVISVREKPTQLNTIDEDRRSHASSVGISSGGEEEGAPEHNIRRNDSGSYDDICDRL